MLLFLVYILVQSAYLCVCLSAHPFIHPEFLIISISSQSSLVLLTSRLVWIQFISINAPGSLSHVERGLHVHSRKVVKLPRSDSFLLMTNSHHTEFFPLGSLFCEFLPQNKVFGQIYWYHNSTNITCYLFRIFYISVFNISFLAVSSPWQLLQFGWGFGGWCWVIFGIVTAVEGRTGSSRRRTLDHLLSCCPVLLSLHPMPLRWLTL